MLEAEAPQPPYTPAERPRLTGMVAPASLRGMWRMRQTLPVVTALLVLLWQPFCACPWMDGEHCHAGDTVDPAHDLHGHTGHDHHGATTDASPIHGEDDASSAPEPPCDDDGERCECDNALAIDLRPHGAANPSIGQVRASGLISVPTSALLERAECCTPLVWNWLERPPPPLPRPNRALLI